MLKFIFLYAFIIASIIQVVGTILHKEMLKNISRLFVIPFLMVFYLLSISKQYISYTFIISLVLVYIGDIILSFKNNKMLIPSGIFLIGSHIFLILAFSYSGEISFNSIPLMYYISVSAVMLGILTAVLVLLRQYFSNKSLIFVAVYLLSSIMMSVFAYFRLACSSILISLIGTIMIFASNVCLLIGRFDPNKKWINRFLVVPLHVVSILLITISFII